jgi:hypothetical protein
MRRHVEIQGGGDLVGMNDLRAARVAVFKNSNVALRVSEGKGKRDRELNRCWR